MSIPIIKTIEGKPYLELPCYPGDTVYSVGPYISLDDNGKMKTELRIHSINYFDLQAIVRNLGDFGNDLFTSLKDAEEYKKKLEEGFK